MARVVIVEIINMEIKTYSTGELSEILRYEENFIHRIGFYGKNGDLWYIDKLDYNKQFQGVSELFYNSNTRFRINQMVDSSFHGVQVFFDNDINFLEPDL